MFESIRYLFVGGIVFKRAQKKKGLALRSSLSVERLIARILLHRRATFHKYCSRFTEKGKFLKNLDDLETVSTSTESLHSICGDG